MGDLENLEIEARRMEKKRKGNEQERKSKRRKLDRLVGCGDVPETSLQTRIVKTDKHILGDL